MAKSAVSLIALIIFLVLVFGAGILIYRFIVSGNAETGVVVIDRNSKFVLDSYYFGNDAVFKIQNNSDKNQTVKKSSDQSTLVEIEANATSRELSLADNSETELFLAGNTSEKTKIKVGNPSASTETNKESPEGTSEPGETAGTTTATDLPNTGPDNNLIFIGLAAVGFLLYRFSRRLLN